MGLPTFGSMGVDWEQRVRFDRLREQRLARITSLLAGSELGALLCFDMVNIRYITATHIGTWAQDKLNRFCLLPQGRSADHVGFRVGGPPPPALQPLAGRRPLSGGDRHHARRHVPPIRAGRGRGQKDPHRARAAGFAVGAGGGGCGRAGGDVRAAGRRRPGRRRPAADAAGPHDQDRGRDHAAQHGLHDGRRRLRTAVSGHAPRLPGKRLRRAGQQGAVRDGLRIRRRRQRHLGRALQPPPPRLHRPRAAARRPGLLRHPAQLQRLPHLLLPHLRRRQRLPGAGRRLQTLPLLPRRRHQPDPARRHHRRSRRSLAQSPRLRLPQRRSRLRAPIRARRRAGHLGETDHQPARLARPPRGDPGGHGLRPRNLLARHRRLVSRPASKNNSSSPTPAAKSSPASPPKTSSSPASPTTPSAAPSRWNARPSRTSTPSSTRPPRRQSPETADPPRTPAPRTLR